MVGQLSLFPSRIVDQPPDTIEMDMCRVRSIIEFYPYPLTSADIQKALPSMSKDRIYHALCQLHKQGEIGWASRATDRGDGRATSNPEPLQEADSQVARPTKTEVARPLKVKGFLKGKSNAYYNWLVSGNKRICYVGEGEASSSQAKIHKLAIEQGISSGRFAGCETKTDYQRIVNQIKSEVEF